MEIIYTLYILLGTALILEGAVLYFPMPEGDRAPWTLQLGAADDRNINTFPEECQYRRIKTIACKHIIPKQQRTKIHTFSTSTREEESLHKQQNLSLSDSNPQPIPSCQPPAIKGKTHGALVLSGLSHSEISSWLMR